MGTASAQPEGALLSWVLCRCQELMGKWWGADRDFTVPGQVKTASLPDPEVCLMASVARQ